MMVAALALTLDGLALAGWARAGRRGCASSPRLSTNLLQAVDSPTVDSVNAVLI